MVCARTYTLTVTVLAIGPAIVHYSRTRIQRVILEFARYIGRIRGPRRQRDDGAARLEFYTTGAPDGHGIAARCLPARPWNRGTVES